MERLTNAREWREWASLDIYMGEKQISRNVEIADWKIDLRMPVP